MEELKIPLVSILIPVYNRENLIERAVLSALNQTYRNIEVIVCDNCSTDRTFSNVAKLVKKDDRIKLFKNERNLGPVLNWGECLAKASGEYAMFLWSDDYISDKFVDSTLSDFSFDIAFVIGKSVITNGIEVLYESYYQRRKVYNVNEYLKSVLVSNWHDFPVSPVCALFRTSDLRQSFLVDIPNKAGLSFSGFGAGNDLYFFLLTASRYRFLKTNSNAISFLYSHSGSITVSNNLYKYYELTKLYFIMQHMPGMATLFGNKHYLRRLLKMRENIDSHEFLVKDVSIISILKIIYWGIGRKVKYLYIKLLNSIFSFKRDQN